MARRCDICSKGRTIGKSGAHKYGGKWAKRAQKKTKIWRPNLQNYTLDGKKMKLCTRCIKRIKFELRKKGAETKKKEEVKIPQKVETKKETKETKKKTSRKSTKKS